MDSKKRARPDSHSTSGGVNSAHNKMKSESNKSNHKSGSSTSKSSGVDGGGGRIIEMDDNAKLGKGPAAQKQQLSKKEAKAKRIQENKEWKFKARTSWSEEDPNPRHTLYYLSQFPDLQSEWNDIRQHISMELPVTFRVGHVASSSPSLRALLKSALLNIKRTKGKFIQVKDVVLSSNDLINEVPWMDDAWQLGADSSSLSKESSLVFLKDILHNYVSTGLIIRQELVSMIPAALLDVRPWHTVIDMCAAPGSKTSQLLQLMTDQCFCESPNGEISNKEQFRGKFPTGVVIANDADPKRIETLRNRFSHSEHPSLIITCSRAEDLVRRLIDSNITIDRIICDVPCSGDGTFRKSPHLWRLFRPRSALELHPLQLQIAISGFSILRPGGRMVYSTCSLNPIEDEAVVLGLLRHFKGQIRIVDVRAASSSNNTQETFNINELLPLLKSRPGLTYWHCNSDVFTVGEEDESSKKRSVSMLPPILSSMYPPEAAEAASLGLERCLRILPHDQNTGGFFIAVLEKLDGGINKGGGGNAGSSSSASSATKLEKFTDIIGNTQAMEVMKKLGYNPKKSQNPNINANPVLANLGDDKEIDGKLENYFNFINQSGELHPLLVQTDLSSKDSTVVKSAVNSSNNSVGLGKSAIPANQSIASSNFRNLRMMEAFNASKKSADGTSQQISSDYDNGDTLFAVRAVSKGVKELLKKDSLEGLRDHRVGLLVGSILPAPIGRLSDWGEKFVVNNICSYNFAFISSLLKPEMIFKLEFFHYRALLTSVIAGLNSGDNSPLIVFRKSKSSSDNGNSRAIELQPNQFDELKGKIDSVGGHRNNFIFLGIQSELNSSVANEENENENDEVITDNANSGGNSEHDNKRRRLSKAEKKKLKKGLDLDSKKNQNVALMHEKGDEVKAQLDTKMDFDGIILVFELHLLDEDEVQLTSLNSVETCNTFQQLLTVYKKEF